MGENCFTRRRFIANCAITLTLHGPGMLVGDNPFVLDANGGVGAVYVKSKRESAGTIRIAVSHPSLGNASAEIVVWPSPYRNQSAHA